MMLIQTSSRYLQHCRRCSSIVLALLMVCAVMYARRFLLKKNESNMRTNKMGNLEQKIKLFQPRISEEERRIFKKLLTAFTQAVPANVTYFMYAGTLLGSYRHHGMIPWDDDIDFVVKYEDKPTLFSRLESLYPEYRLAKHHKANYLWKFYHRSASPLLHWGYPFIDIFFYFENQTSIWDKFYTNANYTFDKKFTFPLTKRPFMGLSLPAPKNTYEFLREMYDVNMCVGNIFDHRAEVWITENAGVQVPCDYLKDKYPFVEREYYENLVLETLVGRNGKRQSHILTVSH